MELAIMDFVAILGPTFAFLGWFYNRIDKKFDAIDTRFVSLENKMDDRFVSVLNEIKEMKHDIRSIDNRLSKIEGKYEERSYQELRRRKV